MLENLNIPRYIFREDLIVIHVFPDSSSLAYGAEIYVQLLPVEGFSTAQLLCNKSTVAPIKRVSICVTFFPLLAKLMNKVVPSLDV